MMFGACARRRKSPSVSSVPSVVHLGCIRSCHCCRALFMECGCPHPHFAEKERGLKYPGSAKMCPVPPCFHSRGNENTEEGEPGR